MATFKFRCNVVGHEKDVRAVCPSYFPENSFVSGSRDVTARVWVPNDKDIGFTEGHCMSGHSNFVSAICVMPPDDQYAQGLIITGSNDHNIFAYTLDSPQPVFKLTDHTDTVCALSCGKFGTLLSGSWDKTAKVWINKKCVMTLEGHEAAVWAVAIMPEGGFMLTGSADRTIKMWKAGRCVNTYNGHEDCVRGLAVLSTSEFLSCSNDGTIKRWLTSGDCVHTYYGHANFVYSIAVLSNGEDFVSTSEDRTLKIWRGGECVQTIAHPTQSVWTVCCLSNGDVVTGASDGVIRVFTASVDRAADEEAQKAYEEQVASSAIPTQIGDLNTDQLPGPEALFNPGKRDGQTMMVKDGDRIQAHQWSAGEKRWIKMGDVVGGSGGSQASSGKQLFEGKEYDYVFDVDIEEGQPPLKLPYNTSEDPWFAAQNFLHRYDLSQLFLDQVAKFIVDNTKGVTLGAPTPAYSDPFTGGSRYVPGSGGGVQSGQGGSDPFTGGGRYVPSHGPQTAQTAAGADPFTGGSSYRPGGAAVAQAASVNPYFPKTSYLTFDTANSSAIIGKLKEFNGKVGDCHHIAESTLDKVQNLIDGKSITAEHLELQWKLLQWPPDFIFPVLDVLRLAIRTEVVNQHFCNDKDGPMFLNHILGLIAPGTPPANQMLCLRALVNAWKESSGEKLLQKHYDQVISGILHCQESGNKNVQIACSSVLLNYAVALHKKSDMEAKCQCLSAAATLLQSPLDNEALFRHLVCIGTLIAGDPNTAELAKSLDIRSLAQKFQAVPEPKKVSECAKIIKDLL